MIKYAQYIAIPCNTVTVAIHHRYDMYAFQPGIYSISCIYAFQEGIRQICELINCTL